jgi:hypothetical protein
MITNDELYGVLRDLKALLESQAGKSDNVELTKNSKGYTWSIKVYSNVGEAALTKIKKLDEQLAATYGAKL